ncbi:hypothetical protein FG05_35268 [Fusarium graminearum]|nr:hypothetical protein FG05_35268 [Fusarium graminearum]
MRKANLEPSPWAESSPEGLNSYQSKPGVRRDILESRFSQLVFFGLNRDGHLMINDRSAFVTGVWGITIVE